VSYYVAEPLIALLAKGQLDPPQARVLTAYASDVQAVVNVERMPERRREAQERSTTFRQDAQHARQRVEQADAAMGDSARRIVRRIVCNGESPLYAATALKTTVIQAIAALAWAGQAITPIYREAADA
jgi:hypothetical protein